MRGGQPVSEEDLALGRRLAAIRSEVGLSQTEVARRLGFAQSRIAKLETGTRRLLFSDAIAITDLYGVGLSALLADTQPRRGTDDSQKPSPGSREPSGQGRANPGSTDQMRRPSSRERA